MEFVAATAWLAELFTHRERREAVIGYTQGFSSTGGLLISAAYYVAVTYSQRLPLIHGGHAAWRYTAISGLVPAIPLIVLRPFLPESPIWKRKKAEGTLKRPSFAELFRPAFRKTALDHLPDDGLLVCRVVWHVAAFRQNHSRHAGSAHPAGRRRRNSA